MEFKERVKSTDNSVKILHDRKTVKNCTNIYFSGYFLTNAEESALPLKHCIISSFCLICIPSPAILNALNAPAR